MKHLIHALVGVSALSLLYPQVGFGAMAYEAGQPLLVTAVGDAFPQPVAKTIADSNAIRVGALTPQGLPALTGQGVDEVDIAVVEATTGAAAMQVTDALDTVATMLQGITVPEARHLLKMTAQPTFWQGVGRFDRSELLRKAQRLVLGWPANRNLLEGAVVLPSPANTRQYLSSAGRSGMPLLRRLEAVRAAGSQGYKEIVEGALLEGLHDMVTRGREATDGERLVTVALAAAPKHMIDLSSLNTIPRDVAVRLIEISSAIGRKDYAGALIARINPRLVSIAAAAAAGQIEMVKWLVSKGALIAGPGAGRLDPLIAAAAATDGGAVARFLVENGARAETLPVPQAAVAQAEVAAAADVETVVALADQSKRPPPKSPARQMAKSLASGDFLAALGIIPTN